MHLHIYIFQDRNVKELINVAVHVIKRWMVVTITKNLGGTVLSHSSAQRFQRTEEEEGMMHTRTRRTRLKGYSDQSYCMCKVGLVLAAAASGIYQLSSQS